MFAITRELRPARAIPAVQVTGSIGPGNVVAVGAVDGRQFSGNFFPRGFARQHAVDILIRVDNPLLAVGANGNMDTSTRKLVPATILVFIQLLRRINAHGTFISPGVNLKQSQTRLVSVLTNKKVTYLNAGTGHPVPFVGGSIPSVNLLAGVAAPDGIINAGSSPDGSTREFRPGIVVVVPSVDRLAWVTNW